MELKIEIKKNVYNKYGDAEVKVIMNLQTRPEGMTLDEIKDLCYTISLPDSTKTLVNSGGSYMLNSLAKKGVITIDNDIVKLNDDIEITIENNIVNIKLNQEK